MTGHIYTSGPSPFIFSFTAIKKHIVNLTVMYTSSHILTSALIFRELLAESIKFLTPCCCGKSLLS